MTGDQADLLRDRILSLVEEYAAVAYKSRKFEPGQSAVPPAGRVVGADELRCLVDSALDGWLTTGRYNTEFQKCLAQFLGVPHVLTVNSGSSANLCAVTALTSPKLGDRRLVPGDEVITVAAGFPTTVNAVFCNNLVPVFVDIDIPTYNINPLAVEHAIGPRTRAIVLAHTLGNPFNLGELKRICDAHDLWLIEDCCDALGSRYGGRLCGTFGDFGTLSFYPAHHITMGEGGAVFTSNGLLRRIALSIRDWGRDCYCDPGIDNTCGKRFAWKLGELPFGYDHKYIYSHLGYNLKITDMQAAVGVAQMLKLDFFMARRRQNFRFLYENLKDLEEFLILPEATQGSDPCWFGFPLTLREKSIARHELQSYLEHHKIGSRLLFAGNLVHQPYLTGRSFRVSGSLENTDIAMERTFWIGIYPGLNESHLSYVAEKLCSYFGRSVRSD